MYKPERVWKEIEIGHRSPSAIKEDTVYLTEEYAFKPVARPVTEDSTVIYGANATREAADIGINVPEVVVKNNEVVGYERVRNHMDSNVRKDGSGLMTEEVSRKVGTIARELHQREYDAGFGRIISLTDAEYEPGDPLETQFDSYPEYVEHIISRARRRQKYAYTGPYIESCIAYLRSHEIPDPDTASLCHCDLHEKNVLSGDGGLVLLDFDGALLAPGTQDLARFCLKQIHRNKTSNRREVYGVSRSQAAAEGYGKRVTDIDTCIVCVAVLRELIGVTSDSRQLADNDMESKSSLTDEQERKLKNIAYKAEFFLPGWMG